VQPLLLLLLLQLPLLLLQLLQLPLLLQLQLPLLLLLLPLLPSLLLSCCSHVSRRTHGTQRCAAWGWIRLEAERR
jgi:hypothetical protein